MAKVQYNPQQVPPFTQEVPSASNQILPATALHVQHLKENTLSQCTESLLQESHFLPHSPEGEQKKNDGERLKEEKKWKERMGHNNSHLSSLLLYVLSSKEDRVRASCTVAAQFTLLQRSHPRCTPSTAMNCQLC